MKLLCGPVVLLLFSAFSLLLYVFRVGYLIIMRACKPAAKVLSPFIEAPFLALQVMRFILVERNPVKKYCMSVY